MSWFVVAMQVGMWIGYVSFGYITDAIGRKRVYVTYLRAGESAAAAVRIAHDAARAAPARAVRRVLRHGILQRLRGGDGRDLSDVHSRDGAGVHVQPRSHRQRGGAVHGRRLATTSGFSLAFTVAGAAYLLAALTWFVIPETRGRELA